MRSGGWREFGASAPATLQRLRRSKKRRLEEEADEHHGEFDANALREHEEFTKVKNVEMVELGRHTMETWYFSPLPAEYSNCKARIHYFWLVCSKSACPGTSCGYRRSTASARRVSTILVHGHASPVYCFYCMDMHALVPLAPAGRR